MTRELAKLPVWPGPGVRGSAHRCRAGSHQRQSASDRGRLVRETNRVRFCVYGIGRAIYFSHRSRAFGFGFGGLGHHPVLFCLERSQRSGFQQELFLRAAGPQFRGQPSLSLWVKCTTAPSGRLVATWRLNSNIQATRDLAHRVLTPRGARPRSRSRRSRRRRRRPARSAARA